MTELYVPTQKERKLHDVVSADSFMLSGDGIFASLQGEGANAGRPSVFLRLQNCNLKCGNNEGWLCDTWYTWDKTKKEYWQESRIENIENTVTEIETAWKQNYSDESLAPNLVITGGEPLLQQEKILKLLPLLVEWDIEIETNGTILPAPLLRSAQINCSPKLASSGNNYHARYRPDVLRHISKFPNYWLKFVISSEDDLIETEAIIKEVGIDDFTRILFMNEGTDAMVLKHNDPLLFEIALSKGYGMTARNHIYWFGDNRRT